MMGKKKQLINALSFIAIVRGYASVLEDQASNCKALVASGKCETERQKVREDTCTMTHLDSCDYILN